MSFHTTITHRPPYNKESKIIRKEQYSLGKDHFRKIFHISFERTSAVTSLGSITLEAAVVIPVFFLAILCLVYILEMMAIQTSMRNALYCVGRKVAQEAYALPIFSEEEVEKYIIEAIGEERLNRSMIRFGASGINCEKSSSGWGTGEYTLCAAYELEIPVLMFRIPILSCEESLKVKGWNGYAESISLPEWEKVVYITDYGLVYHAKRDCTYLELSVRAVPAEEIKELRNQSGGRYYACQFCKWIPSQGGKLYVTDYGNRYHNSLECSRIKRNVYAVPLDEIFGIGGCSKCVK